MLQPTFAKYNFAQAENTISGDLMKYLSFIIFLIFLPVTTSARENTDENFTHFAPFTPFTLGECGRFLISSEEELRQIQGLAELFARTNGDEGCADFLSSDFVLTRDIDLTNNPWTPIGDAASGFVFSGAFDGGGFVVRGLMRNFFGKTKNAEIRNLTLENVYFRAEAGKEKTELGAGILAAEISGGHFENVHVSGEIEAPSPVNKRAVGGFAGLVRGNAVFENCHAMVNVSGNAISGGFAGRVIALEKDAEKAAEKGIFDTGAEFINCFAYGNVTGETAGGFVGQLSNRSRVTSSHAGGNIFAPKGFAGGFAGEITHSSRIEFSSSAGAVYGNVAGGFVALIAEPGAPNTITSCLSLAPVVSASTRAHRFAGRSDHDGINGCYSFLGTILITNGAKTRVTPSPFGPDGGDISRAQVDFLTLKPWAPPKPGNF